MKRIFRSIVWGVLMVGMTTTMRAKAPALSPQGPPIYLPAYFEEGGRRFIHWTYNLGDPAWTAVKISAPNGTELATVSRPRAVFDVTDRPVGEVLQLTPISDTGLSGAAQSVKLMLDRALEVPWVGRIGVRDHNGRAMFYNRANGQPFHPRGFNYIVLDADHATFEALNPRAYDPYAAEAAFRFMAQNGYNTVRVFLAGRNPRQQGIAGEPNATEGIYVPYMDNVADFLARAARYDIHVVFNFCDANLPHNAYFRKKAEGAVRENEIVLTRAGLDAHKEYVASVLMFLKRKNPELLKVVLGVQFTNEMAYSTKGWPFHLRTPVTTVNGKTYNMAEPLEKAACAEEGWLYYYETMHRLVKAIDPQLLTCEGVYVAGAVGRDYRAGSPYEAESFKPPYKWDVLRRCPPSLWLLARTSLDFIDVHLYPDGAVEDLPARVQDLLESSLFTPATAAGLGSRKPLVLGEFGAFRKRDPDFESACRRIRETRRLACEKHGARGFLMWTFDTFNQVDLYHAMADGGEFVRQFGRFESVPRGMPPTGAPVDAAHAVKNPIALADVAPNGGGKGFVLNPKEIMP